MKRIALFVLFALLMLGANPGAQAQYSADPGSALQLIGSGQKHPNYFGGISVLPATVFDIGGTLAGRSGTRSLYGLLVDAEFGTTQFDAGHKPKTIYQLGAWYWGREGSDLYEIHARIQSPRGLGFQYGYLNTTQGFSTIPGLAQRSDASASDLFLLYRLSSYSLGLGLDDNKRPIETYHHWSLEFGAGLFIDTSSYAPNPGVSSATSRAASANYTFYVNGSYLLAPRLSLQVSEWVLRDRSQDLNRVALGLGYSF